VVPCALASLPLDRFVRFCPVLIIRTSYAAACVTPRLVSLVDEVVDVVERRDGQLAEVLDVRPVERVFSHAQTARRRVLGVQQVTHVLAVDLHVAHLHTIHITTTSRGLGFVFIVYVHYVIVVAFSHYVSVVP